jgi:hypothetical protein
MNIPHRLPVVLLTSCLVATACPSSSIAQGKLNAFEADVNALRRTLSI